MLLFNVVLLVHFAAFLSYLVKLALLYPKKNRVKDPYGLVLGIILLATGLLLVALKYPAINYYKIIPKTSLFAGVTVINILYSKKPLSPAAYYLLVAFTLLAAFIAVVKV